MKTTLRPGTLEHAILAALPAPIDPLATYTVRAHELTHDGEGWSSNDRFTIAKDVTAEQMLETARERFDVFKANYAPRARIMDLEALDTYNDEEDDEETTLSLEIDFLPFLDIETTRPRWSVIVGNLGEVHSSHSYPAALADFEEYKEQSETNYGRAGGEPVTLCADDEPHQEHEGEPSDEQKAEEILESLTNGQRTQARAQFKASGLTLADMIDHQEEQETPAREILKTVRALSL